MRSIKKDREAPNADPGPKVKVATFVRNSNADAGPRQVTGGPQ
jgi:hypothetical protein